MVHNFDLIKCEEREWGWGRGDIVVYLSGLIDGVIRYEYGCFNFINSISRHDENACFLKVI